MILFSFIYYEMKENNHNKDYERLLEQSVDILIYDINNKYQYLKNQGLNKDKISEIMNTYQSNRSKEFANNYKLIKKMIKEAVDEALEENGLIVESSEKANEMLSFKVGKHVFEGRVTKIKKLT